MNKPITLSGGNFGGQRVAWPSGSEIISIQAGPEDYWHYNIIIHDDDMHRADLCGCSKQAQGAVLAPADLLAAPNDSQAA